MATASLYPAPPLALPRVSGALSITALNKEYQLAGRARPVLRDVNLEVAAGSFVVIVGPSGCGKSTLLRLIVGLDTQYSGQIYLDGELVRSTSLDRGLVFQDHRLFPWMTVEENVAVALTNRDIPAQRKRELVTEHLKLVRLEGFERAYPHQLSGGMAQRAAIARALVNEPKLLVLDEPFGSLDALTRLKLQRELQRIWSRQQSTMIMVTHDVEEALYLGDRVLVMDATGRIARIVDVPGEHPHDRTQHVFRKLQAQILADLEQP